MILATTPLTLLVLAAVTSGAPAPWNNWNSYQPGQSCKTVTDVKYRTEYQNECSQGAYKWVFVPSSRSASLRNAHALCWTFDILIGVVDMSPYQRSFHNRANIDESDWSLLISSPTNLSDSDPYFQLWALPPHRKQNMWACREGEVQVRVQDCQ